MLDVGNSVIHGMCRACVIGRDRTAYRIHACHTKSLTVGPRAHVLTHSL